MASPFIGKATSAGGGGGAFEVPDADTHHGVLVAIIDLGSHESSYQGGEIKEKRQVALVWELTEAKKSTGESHFVLQRYNLSFHSKSTLRQDLETWRRGKYEDGKEIDLTKFIGQPWAIGIAHDEKGQGDDKKVYAKISSVGPVKKGTQVAAATVKPFFWFIGCGDAVPDHAWLPRVYGQVVKDMIQDSPEWKQQGQPVRQEATTDQADEPVGVGGEEEIPF